MTGSTFGGAARLAPAKDGKSANTQSTKMSRVIAASAYKRSYNVILSEAKNLGSFLGRYLIEIDQRCFAEPVLSKAEGLNMTASLARGVRLLDKTKIKQSPNKIKWTIERHPRISGVTTRLVPSSGTDTLAR